MAYCTLSDINKLLPQEVLIRLTDDDMSGSVDDDVVTESIDSASDEMDVYLGSRYELPITETVDILIKLNVDIAIYNLYSRVKDSIPETRNERYKNAIRMLEKIADGKIDIIPKPDPPSSISGSIKTKTRTKEFSETILNTY